MAKPKSSDAITQVVNTQESSNGDRLGVLKARLEISKKWAEQPHKAFKKWIKEYEIDDLGNTDEIRDKVRIGYIFRRSESDLPAIFDDQPDLFFKGRGDKKILEPLIQGLYEWLWDVQNLEEIIEDAAAYFVLIGMGFVKSPYVTKNKKVKEMQPQPMMDEMGQPLLDQAGQPLTHDVEVEYEVSIVDQPEAYAPNPFNLFFSPETIFSPLMDAKHCPYYFEKHTMTVEEVEARFGKQVDSDESLHIDDDEDTNEEIENYIKTDAQKDDLKRVTVWEYYGILPKELASGITGASEWEYDKEYHVWFTSKEELLSEECPYDSKPLFMLGNYGLANKFWKFGEAKHLMPLVQELQMYRSQVLRHTRKMANPKALIPEDANVDEKMFRDPREGVVVKYNPGVSGAKPEYLQPSNLGGEVQAGIQEVRSDLEKTSGTFELASGSGESQVRTPRGIATFSEAADKNIRRKRKKVARLIRQLIIFQFKQIAANWQPDGTHTIDVVASGNPEEVPVAAEVLAVLGDPAILSRIDVEVESLSVNRVQMKQDALDLLDTALNSEAQYPGLLNLEEIWKDVLQNAFNKRDGDKYLNPPEVRQQMLQQQAQAANPPETPEAPAKLAPIPFEGLPVEGKIQAAAMAGVQISPEAIAQQDALELEQQDIQNEQKMAQMQMKGGQNAQR